ncbi:MAG: nucleotidyltransferase family protein [Candidatus Izemoplasmatales bacterium]|jgi:hypothetical protein|nr:nucleotidyltransferase family protein [Candidatus Izemoplasmatales bacterium]
MENNDLLLFEIIKKTLRNELYDGELSKELYILAKENGLSGMVYKTLQPLNDEQNVLPLFKRDYYEYVRTDTLQSKTIEEVRQIFSASYIDHIFLKGSFLKNIYPETYMRSMGDIDILVKRDKMRLVHQILDEYKYINWSNSSAHDCFYKGRKIFLEIHPKLDSEFDPKYSLLFENGWEETTKTASYEYEFKPMFHLAYLLYHMIKHLSSAGIGLRNILDIGLFVQKYETNLPSKLLHDYLDKFHIDTFFLNIIYLAISYFNFKYQEDYLADYQVDAEFTKNITSFILKSGVHGQGKENNPFLSGMTRTTLSENNIKKGKFIYILSKLFPPYRMMRGGDYAYIDKFPILLPISWVHRAFKLIFKKPKNTMTKLKKLKIDDNEVLHLEKLFEKLGL